MNLRRLINRVLGVHNKLFMDLDGTLIKTISGETFPKDYDDWEMMPGIIEALKVYKPSVIHIVTNQGGIGRGFVDQSLWLEKVDKVISILEREVRCPVTLDFCIHDTDTFYRKHNPGMVLEHMDGVNPSSCLMVGDASGLEGQFSDSDKVCALNAGISYMDVSEFISKHSS